MTQENRQLAENRNLIALTSDIENAGYITDELLPCPLCGKKPLSYGEQNQKTKNIVYHVSCPGLECGANVFTCVSESDGAEMARGIVVKKWNTRHLSAQRGDEREIAAKAWDRKSVEKLLKAQIKLVADHHAQLHWDDPTIRHFIMDTPLIKFK